MSGEVGNLKSAFSQLSEDIDFIEDLLVGSSVDYDVQFTQGFWNTVSNINASNTTLCCNAKKLHLPAYNSLVINPNGKYMLAQYVNGSALTAVGIWWDDAAASTTTYATGTAGIITAVGYDRELVFRIGKDANHSQDITPSEITATFTAYKRNNINTFLSLSGAINITYANSSWTFAPSADFIGAVFVPNFAYVRDLAPVSVQNPDSGTVCVYYSSTDGLIHAEKLSTRKIVKVDESVICFVYNNKIIPVSSCAVECEAVRMYNPSNCGGIICGLIWMFVSNGKLNIITDSHARAFYNNDYVDIASKTLSVDVSGTRAVCLDGNGFSVKNIVNTTNKECVVAYVYSGYVYPLFESIFANTLPVTGLVQRTDIPIFINNKKIPGYQVASRNTTYAEDFGYWLKLVNASGYSNSPISYVEKSGKRVAGTETVDANSASISNKKILCIGDSITRRGWYQQRIKSYVSTVQFLGTQDTYYNSLKCEGYSGRKASDVLGSPTISVSGSNVVNPFWDSTQNKCDFAYYCTSQNVHPDYVIIEFGLNETDASAYFANVQNFIATIKAFDSTIKVYVIQPFAESSDAADNHTGSAQRNALDACVLNSYSFTDAVLVPCWYIMIDEYDYTKSNVEYGYGNITVSVDADGVHPAETTGFAKLGDMIYNYLGY